MSADVQTVTARPRSLWPKEHGAYGQLGLPLGAALAMSAPSLPAILLVVAAAAAFVAHEPIAILLGVRGARAKRDHKRRALRWAIAATALALATGKAGVWLGGTGVLLASILPVALVALLVPFVVRGAEKTAAGELTAAAALSAAAIPVAVAGGLDFAHAHFVWSAWLTAFAVSTGAVRYVITRHKSGRGERMSLVTAAVATAAIPILARTTPVVLAALPMVLLGWALILRPPHPRRLRQVGWALVAASASTAVLAVAIVRILCGASGLGLA